MYYSTSPIQATSFTRSVIFSLSLAVGLSSWSAISLADGHLPLKGTLKAKVSNQFGQPDNKEGPVGQPPITRWQYDNFSVVFEYDHVVHAYARLDQLEGEAIRAIPRRQIPTNQVQPRQVQPGQVQLDSANTQRTAQINMGGQLSMPAAPSNQSTQVTPTQASAPQTSQPPISPSIGSIQAPPMTTPATTPSPDRASGQPPRRNLLPTPDNTFPGERQDDATRLPDSLDPTFFNPDDYR